MRSILVLVAFAAAGGGASARTGVVGHEPERPALADHVVLGGSFRAMRGVTGLSANGDYLLLGTTVGGDSASTGWIVINTRLGTRTELDPQCHLDGLGPPWVLIGCPATSNPYGPFDVELYSLPDGTSQTVAPSPGVPYCSASSPPPASGCASADAVGAYWIRWDSTCAVHCGHTYFFQNIQTGELRDDPTDATTFADLNSPVLARSTCPGVQLLHYFDYGVGWGSLTPYGRFALAAGGPDGGVFLERCGTGKRRWLVNGITAVSEAVASNSSAIVWQSRVSHLSGLFLPSLQRFTISLPAAIQKPRGAPENTPITALVLTSSALYVEDGYGAFWRTATPAALPLNTSRPSVARSGSTVTCRRGTWRNADRFSYVWRIGDMTYNDASPTLAAGDAGERRVASCSVTASNVAGTTTASSAPPRVG